MGTELGYSQDQALALGLRVIAKANEEVDESIDMSLLDGSPMIALNFGYNLIQTGQMRGIQLARLLYMLQETWDSWETDDTVEDAVFKSMGVPSRKFEAYTELYRYVLKGHPELSGKPMGGLLGIVVAAREGEFSEEDWKELALAHDKTTMLDIRRRVRGIQTKGHARVVIEWDRDGFVRSYCGNAEPETHGHLGKHPVTPHGKIAMARLMDDRVIKR